MSSPQPRRIRGRGGKDGHEPRGRILVREARALEMWVQGCRQQQIAADLGVSQPAVSKIIRRLEERHYRDTAAIMDRLKARQALRLEALYAEAYRAWQESKQDATTRRQRKQGGGEGGPTLAELVVENAYGDPRLLEQCRKILADLRKLQGLDAPQQLDVRAGTLPFDGMTEEQLRSVIQSQAEQLAAFTEPTPKTGGDHAE